MKGLFIGVVMMGAMLHQLAAQNVSATATRDGAPYSGYTLGTVVALPIGNVVPALVISNPRRWFQPPGSPSRHGDGFPDSGYASDPFFYPETYDDAYPVGPSAIVAVPVILNADTPPPPPPTPESDMRDYHWPSSGGRSSATTYSIVSKDGKVLFAAAVWIQDNVLSYYTPDHNTGRIPIGSIDRQATRQRNAEQQIILWLPPER
jgi:hypothetical protein